MKNLTIKVDLDFKWLKNHFRMLMKEEKYERDMVYSDKNFKKYQIVLSNFLSERLANCIQDELQDFDSQILDEMENKK